MALSAQTGISAISTLTTDAPLPVKAGNYPKPSDEALEFIETVVPADFDDLLYNDELTIYSETGKELGEFVVNISPAKKEATDCFLVHANSQGVIDGIPCGTSVTAYVTKTLDTLEQTHHEYIKLENHLVDKKTFIKKEGAEYQVNKVIQHGSKTDRIAVTYLTSDMKGFVSEGSNLLMMRLMVKKGFLNGFQAISFDADTNLCPAPYVALTQKSQTICDEPVLVTGIQRSIESPSDLVTTWHSYFDQYGHMTSRVQVGSPAIMRVQRVPEEIVKDEVRTKPTFEKKKLDWEEDEELNSKYLDRKAELEDDHALYMRQHPELRNMMADFLQYLLLRKPDDSINFAAEYFASFSTRAIETTAYANSAAPTPFPPSRTNTILSISQKIVPK